MGTKMEAGAVSVHEVQNCGIEGIEDEKKFKVVT
jgi:hypothetical protein